MQRYMETVINACITFGVECAQGVTAKRNIITNGMGREESRWMINGEMITARSKNGHLTRGILLNCLSTESITMVIIRQIIADGLTIRRNATIPEETTILKHFGKS